MTCRFKGHFNISASVLLVISDMSPNASPEAHAWSRLKLLSRTELLRFLWNPFWFWQNKMFSVLHWKLSWYLRMRLEHTASFFFSFGAWHITEELVVCSHLRNTSLHSWWRISKICFRNATIFFFNFSTLLLSRNTQKSTNNRGRRNKDQAIILYRSNVASQTISHNFVNKDHDDGSFRCKLFGLALGKISAYSVDPT